MPCPQSRPFPRNLAPDLTHYLVNTERQVEPYEQSRQRNDNHNVSASHSLAWAHGNVRNGGMARTHGNATNESERKLSSVAFQTCRIADPPYRPGVKRRPRRVWRPALQRSRPPVGVWSYRSGAVLLTI